jgi:hypothetical protein
MMHAHVLQAALGQKATILAIKDELYATQWFDVGWWVWRLEESAPEYFIVSSLDKCTCPAFAARKKCKHIDALQTGIVQKRDKVSPKFVRERGER